MVCEPTVITDPQPVYRPLPTQLVEPLPYPPGLEPNFTGRDTLDLVFHLYDLLDLANSDRIRAGRIANGDEREPTDRSQ